MPKNKNGSVTGAVFLFVLKFFVTRQKRLRPVPFSSERRLPSER